MTGKATPLEKFNRFPPYMCRLVARKKRGYRAMSQRDIAEKSGLSKPTVVRISRLKSWDNLTLKTIESFSGACGVNLLNVRRQINFLRRWKASYVMRANPSQKKFLTSLMQAHKL